MPRFLTAFLLALLFVFSQTASVLHAVSHAFAPATQNQLDQSYSNQSFSNQNQPNQNQSSPDQSNSEHDCAQCLGAAQLVHGFVANVLGFIALLGATFWIASSLFFAKSFAQIFARARAPPKNLH